MRPLKKRERSVSKKRIRRVVFDIETELFPPEFRAARSNRERVKLVPRMRVACVFEEHTGRFRYFTERQVSALIDVLAEANEVVSYNGSRYDLLVLRRHYSLANRIPKKGRHTDLATILSRRAGFNVKLNRAALLNLGESKHTWGRETAKLNLQALKRAARSDVWQTYRLWRLYKQGALRYPLRPMPDDDDSEFGRIAASHVSIPVRCPFCEAQNTLHPIEPDFANVTDGQAADYEAGFRLFLRCSACGEAYWETGSGQAIIVRVVKP
jgi:hypothetical protein